MTLRLRPCYNRITDRKDAGGPERTAMIPCHRVAGTNGGLTGYAGGAARKVKLLELERAGMHGLFVPKKGTAL